MAYKSYNRRASRQKGDGVSLFPFLAVLICAMGALIAILLLIARQTQLTRMTEASEAECGVWSVECEVNDELHTPLFTLHTLSEAEIQEKRNAVAQEKRRFSLLQRASEESEFDLNQAREALSVARAEMLREKEAAGVLAETLSGANRSAENPEKKRASRDLKMRIAEREVEIEKLEGKIRAGE